MVRERKEGKKLTSTLPSLDARAGGEYRVASREDSDDELTRCGAYMIR